MDADVPIHQAPPSAQNPLDLPGAQHSLDLPAHPAPLVLSAQEGGGANEDPKDHLVQVVTAVHADAVLFLKAHGSVKYGAPVIRFPGIEVTMGNVSKEIHPAMRNSDFVQEGGIW